MSSDRTIKVEIEDYIMYDKLNSLVIEYMTTVDRLVNVSIRRLIDDVEFVRELRMGNISAAPHQDEQT